MIEKILVPLEDVPFRGIDNKVRLRYRLVSKDKNESSQWSPVYTINPSEIKSELLLDPGYDTDNPILYSNWEPTSYSDGKNINIKIDSGWVKDKKVIPCNNFDVFVSWNQFNNTSTGYWGYDVSKSATIINVSNTVITYPSAPTEYNSTATITDISTKNINVGDFITTKLPDSPTPVGGLQLKASVDAILGLYSIRVSTTSISPIGIIAGAAEDVKKINVIAIPDLNDFVYAGTTNSGSISIKIPEQVYATDNSIQYRYILTPATNPPTLVETFDGVDFTYTNGLYKSDILTTEATVEPGETSNTYNIDSGSPT